jgi:hypothetical protein
VALSSTASIDFSPSGLAAFRVRPLEAASTYSGVEASRPLLLVPLDDLGPPELGLVRVEAGVAEGAALAEQVPTLVE